MRVAAARHTVRVVRGCGAAGALEARVAPFPQQTAAWHAEAVHKADGVITQQLQTAAVFPLLLLLDPAGNEPRHLRSRAAAMRAQ